MDPVPAPPRQAGERRVLLVVAITLLAFVLRVVYFLGAQVDVPVRGDSLEHWKYAWNLVNHGVFSLAEPGPATPVPDDYRGPGYAVFLAACRWLGGGREPATLALAQWSQLLLGTALVPMTIALGRRWLPMGWALAAGVLVAVWPHLVVFATTLLSETLFAFGLLLSWLLLARAQARDGVAGAAVAGLVAGLATLVNPLLVLFPPLPAAVLALRGQRRCAAAYVLLFVLVNGAWAWRNAGLEAGSSSLARAQINLVQGSYPLFLNSMRDRGRHPNAEAYYQRVVDETARMHAQPRATLAGMAERFRAQPHQYLAWYLAAKPWLLWDWEIAVGWGDIYFNETKNSPYVRLAPLRAMHAVCKALNPLLLALAVLATAAAAWQAARRRWPAGHAAAAPHFAELVVALCFVYVTAIHVVLQGEPRYAIAYRPLEFLLAMSALAWVAGWWRARRPTAA